MYVCVLCIKKAKHSHYTCTRGIVCSFINVDFKDPGGGGGGGGTLDSSPDGPVRATGHNEGKHPRDHSKNPYRWQCDRVPWVQQGLEGRIPSLVTLIRVGHSSSKVTDAEVTTIEQKKIIIFFSDSCSFLILFNRK